MAGMAAEGFQPGDAPDDLLTLSTVHQAKGLEFPITIVAGLTTKPRRTVTNGVVWANDTWMLAGRGDDGVFVAQQPIDEQMGDAERRRLLYVACTPAVDHLVVSLHRGAPNRNNACMTGWPPAACHRWARRPTRTTTTLSPRGSCAATRSWCAWRPERCMMLQSRRQLWQNVPATNTAGSLDIAVIGVLSRRWSPVP